MSQHQINLQDNTLTSIFLYGKLFIEPTLIHQHFMSGEFINIETIDHDYFRDTDDKLFDLSCDSFSTLRNIHGNHWGFVGSLIIHDFVQIDGFNKMRINFHITVFDSANTRVEGVTQYLVKFKNFLITLMNILQLDYIINIIPYHYNVTHKQQNGNDCAVFALLYQKQFIKVLLDTERTRYSLLNIDNPITSIPDSKNDYISGMFESCFQNITQNLATQQRVDTILDFCGWSKKMVRKIQMYLHLFQFLLILVILLLLLLLLQLVLQQQQHQPQKMMDLKNQLKGCYRKWKQRSQSHLH